MYKPLTIKSGSKWSESYIYVISDEEIKSNDYTLEVYSSYPTGLPNVLFCKKRLEREILLESGFRRIIKMPRTPTEIKKIVATNDPELTSSLIKDKFEYRQIRLQRNSIRDEIEHLSHVEYSNGLKSIKELDIKLTEFERSVPKIPEFIINEFNSNDNDELKILGNFNGDELITTDGYFGDLSLFKDTYSSREVIEFILSDEYSKCYPSPLDYEDNEVCKNKLVQSLLKFTNK